jgi:hypothetical protein
MDKTETHTVAYFVLQDGLPGSREVSISDVLVVRPTFIIGSDARAHLQILEDGIAPAHAVVSRKDDAYMIQPRFPQCDIYVNDKHVKTSLLIRPGDVVRLGSTILRFSQEDKSDNPAVRIAAPVQSAKPVVQSPAKPSTALAVAKPVSIIAARPSVVPAIPVEIYIPPKASPGSGNTTGLIVGLTTVLGVIGLLLYGFISGVSAGTTSTGDVNFAYNDGRATFVMFDADW